MPVDFVSGQAMVTEIPPATDPGPARHKRPLTSHPAVVLILCAVCIYGALLGLLLGLAARDKIGFFVAAGFSLYAAYKLFLHFLKLKGRSFP
jgi:uncharacterized membrane protein YfcA